jgi:CubicO group peptidase (beta-lactamase class C family)
MLKLTTFILSLALAFQAQRSPISPAPSPPMAGRPGAVDACRKAAEAVFAEDRLPGLSVAVLDDGDLICSQAFGWAERRKKIPVTSTTKFRLGSVSKSLTSAAVGLLIQEGVLDLEAPVQTYVPSFPEKSGRLTTRLAAAHLSGLPHYKGKDFVNRRHYDSVVHALDKFKDRPLVFSPGESFLYSSYGWNLVGAVLERASGSEFLELMRTRVFEPLSLEHTIPEVPDQNDLQRAQPYVRILGLTVRAPKIDNSDAWPSAGFLSNAEDLVRFGDAMLSARLLKAETVDLLWTGQKTASGEETDYGLGWALARKGGRRAVGHGGSHVGATSALWILPEESLVIALATNTNSPNLSGLVDSIVVALLGE